MRKWSMTESELVEASSSYFDLSIQVLSFYMTVTSGYLIVAFLAGAKLTRPQMSIISTLYIFMTVVGTYAAFAWMSRGTQYVLKLEALESSGAVYANPALPFIVSAILMGGIVASLVFMWGVRHPKTH
jgi:hypothetical protein